VIWLVRIEDGDDEVISWFLWGQNVPARMLELQHSSQYFKKVIKSVKLEAQVSHT
jgi:hypothetical protein